MRILATTKTNADTTKEKDTANTVKEKPKAEKEKINDKSPKGNDNTEHKEKNKENASENKNEAGLNETNENDLAAERDKYLRLAAEYDNFRKRSGKERDLTYNNARIDVISKLLPVYDNLERALKMECSDEAFYKGVEMIKTQLIEILEEMGVRQIAALGEVFDPNLHNAVMTIVDPELGENIIADEFQKGFILGDRVIRFSTVVVAN